MATASEDTAEDRIQAVPLSHNAMMMVDDDREIYREIDDYQGDIQVLFLATNIKRMYWYFDNITIAGLMPPSLSHK